MNECSTFVTQSRFFSPSFNAAIFDGPVRIYFAQDQEAQALKVYFNVQERFADLRKAPRGFFKDRARNIFVMLYPNVETFDMTFGDVAPLITGSGAVSGNGVIASDHLGNDYVLGVRGPMEDETLENLFEEMDSILRSAQA